MTTITLDKANFPVPPYFSDLTNAKLETGMNILGADMSNFSYNANYLVATGQQKVPMTFVGDITSAGNKNLYYRVLDIVNPNINERYFNLNFYSFNSIGQVQVEISGALHGVVTSSLQNISPGINQFLIRDSFNSVADSTVTEDLQITLTALSSSTAALVVRLQSIAVLEAPRAYLNPSTQECEQGVDIVSNRPGKPIYTSPGGQHHMESVAGIVEAINFASSSAGLTRPSAIKTGKCLWSYLRTNKTDTAPTGNFNTTNLFYSNTAVVGAKTNGFNSVGMAKPLVFATADTTTTTASLCTVLAYGAVQTAGNVGRLEVSSAVGNTAITINSTTPAWHSASLLVQTEDVLASQYGGIPYLVTNFSGNLDINLTKSTTTGASLFNVWSVMLVEGTV